VRPRSDRRDEDAALGELLEERARWLERRRGDDDPIERRCLGPAREAVAEPISRTRSCPSSSSASVMRATIAGCEMVWAASIGIGRFRYARMSETPGTKRCRGTSRSASITLGRVAYSLATSSRTSVSRNVRACRVSAGSRVPVDSYGMVLASHCKSAAARIESRRGDRRADGGGARRRRTTSFRSNVRWRKCASRCRATCSRSNSSAANVSFSPRSGEQSARRARSAPTSSPRPRSALQGPADGPLRGSRRAAPA
jgi:hypothetical protein